MTVEVLAEPVWRARAAAHEARVDAFVTPHLERRRDGAKHPVHDFLFTYYSQRPAQLRRWHPGFGVALEGAEEYGGLKVDQARRMKDLEKENQRLKRIVADHLSELLSDLAF